MPSLRDFVKSIITYGASIEKTDAGNYFLVVDEDGSVLEPFCVQNAVPGDELGGNLLAFQAKELLEKLKIYRLTRSVAQQMESDESYLS